MSGGRTASTPTPPQVGDERPPSPQLVVLAAESGSGEAQANGENATLVINPDDRRKYTPPVCVSPVSKTLELDRCDPVPLLQARVLSADSQITPGEIPVSAAVMLPSSSPVADMVDGPPAPPPTAPAYPAPIPEPRVIPSASGQQLEEEEATMKEEMEEETEEVAKDLEATEPGLSKLTSSSNGMAMASSLVAPPFDVALPLTVTLPFATAPVCEPPNESPIAQPEELQLTNGLAAPGTHDSEALADSPKCDVSPIAEPEVAYLYSSSTSATSVFMEMPVMKFVPVPTITAAPVVMAMPLPGDRADPLPTLIANTAPAVVATQASMDTAMVAVAATPGPTGPETQALVDAAVVETTTSPSAVEKEDTSPPQATVITSETSTQAVSVPKKKRKMKDLNKKETVGDILDAFKEEQLVESPLEPKPAVPVPANTEERPTPEDVDETWEEKEDKEDKLDAENIEPSVLESDIKYQYKEEQWKPIDPEEKKKYDREFLLGFQFISASMHKPEGLPQISDVVLDKVQANKTPLRQLDPSRLPGMNCGPDFTPSFANLGRPIIGGRGPSSGMSGGGPRRSQQGQRKEPRKIITMSVSLNDDVQLNKAEKAWKPAVKKGVPDADDSEEVQTQELFRRVRSVLNKLTPQMFQQLMKQVTELTIDTEVRLKGVIDLIFEKAISEPNFSVAYANMCRCLMGLKVPTTEKPGITVNFRKLLLNRCQKEFEKDKDDDEIFERKQKEMEDAAAEDKQRLKEELDSSRDQARRRSLGNIKFIGELFKLKMLTEPIMHDCVVKLLKNHDEESLECLCRLLSTIGKDLDFEKAKPRMDQYFNQMEKIIKERKTSSRIRFMLQDVLDVRKNNWISRRGDQGPKTIDQIHKEAEMEEQKEIIKVQQLHLNKKETRGSGGGGGLGGRGGLHTPVGRGSQPQDEGWNTVPISTKNRPIDTNRLSKITKPGALDINNQLLAPGGKGMWGSWGKGSSGGTTGAKPASDPAPESGRPTTSTLNRFSALQQAAAVSGSVPADSDRRLPQRSCSSRERSDRFDRSERFERRDERGDRNIMPLTKRSFSRETKERSRERDQRGPADAVRRVASMTDDRSSRDRARSKDAVKRETAPTPPPPPTKPPMSEEELEKKSTAIIEEYLHINDMQEALQCVQEMNCTPQLFVFVRKGIESTLERSTIAREHIGLLLHQLVKTGTLPKEQYYKGLQEILEIAEDMAIDIPHFWLYLAEIITPMLREQGIPMDNLFREVTKSLVPSCKGVLLVQILSLLCKEMSHKKVGTMWKEAGLSWKEFLPEDEDINKFMTEKAMEFTLGDNTEKSGRKEMSAEELAKCLDRLIQDESNNQRISDWIEANLDEQMTTSNVFVRALMTSVCQSAIICENPYKVDAAQISQRAKLLQKYLKDELKELQALYALQALMVHMEQPANLLRMFFDTLYDEDVIKEEAFYKWESSKDPAEQQGKGVALKSVTAFFTWLREAEDESDNN